MLVCFWLVSQASLLRLPICFSRAGKKQNGSDFEFAFCRAGKKQNGSDFQFAFSRAGKKQNGSDFEFAFSQPGKKQNGSDFHGNKQRLRGSSPRPSAYESSALSIRPHRPQLSEIIAFFRLCKSKLDVQFAFPAQTSNLLFPGPGKSKIGSLSHFAFTQPGKLEVWAILLFAGPGKSKLSEPFCFFQIGICFFQARAGKKQNGSDFSICFFPGREKANWKIGSLSPLLFPGPGKSKLEV